jgi:cyanophycinase
VVGTGSVTIIEGSSVHNSAAGSTRHGEPVGLTGVRLHILTEGNLYNLGNHTLLRSGLAPKSHSTADSNAAALT